MNKLTLLRISDAEYIAANMVTTITVSSGWDSSGDVILISLSDRQVCAINCTSDMFDSYEVAEILAKSVIESVRGGVDIDVRPRLRKPRY